MNWCPSMNCCRQHELNCLLIHFSAIHEPKGSIFEIKVYSVSSLFASSFLITGYSASVILIAPRSLGWKRSTVQQSRSFSPQRVLDGTMPTRSSTSSFDFSYVERIISSLSAHKFPGLSYKSIVAS